MKPKLLILLNHDLTDYQRSDAESALGVDVIIESNDRVRAIWRDLPASEESLLRSLNAVFQFVANEGSPGDFLLVQGDFGAVYLLVQYAMRLGLIPIYSTTKREVVELHDPDGTVRLHRTFKHCRFRFYERLSDCAFEIDQLIDK